MKKNGFTLIELLAVVCLIAIIATIGTFGVTRVKETISLNMWNSKVDLIENKAKTYGEDNKFRLTSSCTYTENGTTVTRTKCLKITVQTLLDANYLPTKEKNESGGKTITRDTESKDSSNYYANDLPIFIYVENDYIYAKLVD